MIPDAAPHFQPERFLHEENYQLKKEIIRLQQENAKLQEEVDDLKSRIRWRMWRTR